MTEIRRKILECLKTFFPDYVDKDILKIYVRLDDINLKNEVQYLKNEDCIEMGKTKDPDFMLARITFTGARALAYTDAQD
jgi:hypothetical protein